MASVELSVILPVLDEVDSLDLDAVMERIERDLIRQALERSRGVQSRAAQLLGTGFRSFRYRLQKYGMADRTDDLAQERSQGDNS